MTNDTADKKRAEFIAGLRALANLLVEHPEVPLPLTGQWASNGIHFPAHDRDGLALFASLIEDPTEGWHDDYKRELWRVDGHLAGLPVFALGRAENLGGHEATKTVMTYEVPSILAAVSS